MEQEILVYVAGPYTGGNCVVNTRRAIIAGLELIDRGYKVHIPHCNLLWDLVADVPKAYDTVLDQDFAILKRCDAVYRLEGYSPGADIEVGIARERDIPVFFEAWGDLELL